MKEIHHVRRPVSSGIMLTFQNVVDWVAVLPGRGEDGKDILSDFELLIWGFARNEDF